jgi:hypothetical protein
MRERDLYLYLSIRRMHIYINIAHISIYISIDIEEEGY